MFDVHELGRLMELSVRPFVKMGWQMCRLCARVCVVNKQIMYTYTHIYHAVLRLNKLLTFRPQSALLEREGAPCFLMILHRLRVCRIKLYFFA